ncbi:MAG: acetyl-CoA C-acetyltransferase [Candidatus Ratteibacteria bacterium]|jgi:acetyl-CoA C-acetyltransferase
MRKAVIAAAARTAIGSFCGILKTTKTVDLGAATIAEAIKRAGISVEQVDEVIMGNALQAGLGQNPARQAAFHAGIPKDTDAITLNKVCGSGLEAVVRATQSIIAGDAEIVAAGGMENMSLAPYLLEKARSGYRLGNGELRDSLLKDGLWCAYGNHHMGITAETIAKQFSISRNDQDAFAAESQAKCANALKNGKFKKEILPLRIPQPKKDDILFETDEFPRPDTSLEKLAALSPVFMKAGTVTAGNASGINDGAAAVVVMSEEKCRALGLTPLAEIIAYASAGVDPALMGMGPIPATQKALAKAGLSLEQMDLIELNEAFAAQSLAVIRELGIPREKLNVNGGAIALGHPIGASGARILVTLLHEMQRQNTVYGLATLCIGGGQGISMIVKR